MLDISLGGLLGAIAGTVVAGVSYHLFIGALEHRMREREQLQSPEERDTFDRKMSLVRRIVLTTDLFLFAAVGYWLGRMIADLGGDRMEGTRPCGIDRATRSESPCWRVRLGLLPRHEIFLQPKVDRELPL